MGNFIAFEKISECFIPLSRLAKMKQTLHDSQIFLFQKWFLLHVGHLKWDAYSGIATQ